MIAGLPAGTWVLMAFAVVPGIVLVTAAYRVHRRGDARDAAQRPDGGDVRGTTQQPNGGDVRGAVQKSDGGDEQGTAREPDGGAPPQAPQRGEAGRG